MIFSFTPFKRPSLSGRLEICMVSVLPGSASEKGVGFAAPRTAPPSFAGRIFIKKLTSYPAPLITICFHLIYFIGTGSEKFSGYFVGRTAASSRRFVKTSLKSVKNIKIDF
jgi:hypothetical protein